MNYRWVVGIVVAVAVYLGRAWPSLWTTVDDAWISARFAAQAAAGNGLVFNAGEPAIEGYTNLLWTLWLAAASLIGGRLDLWMVFSGLGFGCLSVIFAGLLTRALVNDRAWWAPGIASMLIALDVHHAVVSTNGLESAMFTAAVLGSAWGVLAARGRASWAAGLAVGLLGAIRPEGFVIGLSLIALRATSPKDSLPHDVSSVAFPFVLTGLALESWRLWTYGSWVPNTFHAKAKGGLTTYLESNIRYLSPDGAFWIGAAVFGLLALAIGWRDRRRWVLGAAAIAVVAIAFRVELWMPGGRLLVPSFTLLAVLVAAASEKRMGAVLAGLAMVSSLVSPFTSVESKVRRYDRIHSVKMWNATAIAGLHIAKYAPPGSWMAVRDAGVLAHFVGTDVNIAELHNRALTQLHPDGKDAQVLDYTPNDPEFIVLTQARVDSAGTRYTNDRRIFQRAQARYRYLGRVHQHYHRYYDIYVRDDLHLPPLQADIVENHAGPDAPGGP